MGSDTIIFLLGPAHAFRRGAPLPQSFDLFPEALAAQRPSLVRAFADFRQIVVGEGCAE